MERKCILRGNVFICHFCPFGDKTGGKQQLWHFIVSQLKVKVKSCEAVVSSGWAVVCVRKGSSVAKDRNMDVSMVTLVFAPEPYRPNLHVQRLYSVCLPLWVCVHGTSHGSWCQQHSASAPPPAPCEVSQEETPGGTSPWRTAWKTKDQREWVCTRDSSHEACAVYSHGNRPQIRCAVTVHITYLLKVNPAEIRISFSSRIWVHKCLWLHNQEFTRQKDKKNHVVILVCGSKLQQSAIYTETHRHVQKHTRLCYRR